jgi:amino acid transporter
MLSKEEEKFIRYWEIQRKKKKQFLRKLSIGMPLGVIIVVALVVNFLSGWYDKADVVLHQNASVIIVVLIAAVGIVVFITIFSARHKWDQNELHYQELIEKMDRADAAGNEKTKS